MADAPDERTEAEVESCSQTAIGLEVAAYTEGQGITTAAGVDSLPRGRKDTRLTAMGW